MKSLFVLLFLLCFSFASAQSGSNSTAGSMDSILATLSLDSVDGKVKAFHSKGYVVRTKTLQDLIMNCCSFYEKVYPAYTFSLELLVLNEKDWNALGTGIPYGMPASLSSDNKILIAADKQYVGALFGKSDTLPDNVLSEFDYIALHELGHNFFDFVLGLQTGKRWANEFLASYFALCYLNETQSPVGLPDLGSTGFQPQYKTLEDFERLYAGVGPQNYGWYQVKFIELGEAFYPLFGLELINTVSANYSLNGQKEDLLVLLKQIDPEITAQWLQTLN